MKTQKLKNGMRVHLVPYDGTDAATVLVLTNVGSRSESDAVWGGSHFIEHLMFKGTERRPNTIDISRTLDRYGAEFNAYTGKDLTGYYVKISADKTDVAVDLLHDMVFNSLYDPEEMDRERKVIIEEIKMYEENPIMHVDDLLERAMFKGTTLGRDIAGTAESMMAMKREDIIAYRDQHYIPDEMVVVISGAVPDNAMTLLEDTFGTVISDQKPGGFEKIDDWKAQDGIRIERQEKDVKQIQIALGFPMVGRTHDDMPAIKLLASIFGGAMSSRLFIEVRERRGLCYSIRASADAYDDIGAFEIRSGLDVERLEEAMKAIFDEVDKIKQNGVTAEELQHAKDRFEGAMKLALENSSRRAEFVGRQELYTKEVKTVEERIAEYAKVTLEDVLRVAQEIFNNQRLSIATIGPFTSDEALLEKMPKSIR
jgi:predicted Zn-dependent peptidase